jgi:phosphatidylglycerophosphatase A
VNTFFLTLGYSGKSPVAPGTVGSFVALILGLLVLLYFGQSTLFLLAILVSIIAIKQIDIYEEKTGVHDDKSIVIDELAGMWIALSIAPGNTEIATTELSVGLYQAIVAFALFRYFDITKPSFIGRVDRDVKGGLGVMGDDIIAGFVAGIFTLVIFTLFNLLT